MFQTNDIIALILCFENFIGFLRQTEQPLQNKTTTKLLEIISQNIIQIDNESNVCKSMVDFVCSKEFSIEIICKKGLFIRSFFLTKKQKDLYIISDFVSHAKNINKHFSGLNHLEEFREAQSIVIENKTIQDSVVPPTVVSLQLDMPKEQCAPKAPKIVRYGFEETKKELINPPNFYENMIADSDDALLEDNNINDSSSDEESDEENEIYDAEFVDQEESEESSIIPFQDINQPVVYGENNSPDSEQLKMINTGGFCLIAAGAGSGKSTSCVNRIKKLIDEGVHPSRIFATTFNTKAIFDFKSKLVKKIGFETLKQMRVGTMHSLFSALVKQFGTAAEKQSMTSGFMAGGGSIFGVAEELYKCSGLEKIHGVPNSKQVRLNMTLWRGNGITPAQALEIANQKNSKSLLVSAKIYEFYEGVKGAIPGWKCDIECKRYTNFVAKYRSVNKRLADFDDQLILANEILKRNPQAKLAVQKSIDHLIIDEAQDVNGVQKEVFDQISENIDETKGQSFHMIGDLNQCVSIDTLVRTPFGMIKAGDLKNGNQVISYRNGKFVSQTVQINPSSWNEGFKIITESGKNLTMTPDHKIWATSPEMPEGSVIVYLMYRRDMGYRVGITNKCQAKIAPFGNRTRQERAERLWILEHTNSRSEALYLEEYYSLKYGVSKAVFCGEDRGLDQNRLDKIFENFGSNGLKILKDKHLSFDLPNWIAYSNIESETPKQTIQFIAHSKSKSQVSLEWSGDSLKDMLSKHSITHPDPAGNGRNRNRLRRYFLNYRDAVEFAEKLKNAIGANLRERLSTPFGALSLLTASALVPTMKVAVYDNGELKQEKIVSIEKVENQKFVDLDVDDASNFLGNDILSHNCIFKFRSARPELFFEVAKNPKFKVLSIRTNYRCPPEIVEMSNRLIENNTLRMDILALPNPSRKYGEGSIVLEAPIDDATAAIQTVHRIKNGLASGKNLHDYAILTRTNKELHVFETACIVNNIPYGRNNASSFLGSPETRAFIGYIELLLGNDNKKKQIAFRDVINNPLRFFVNNECLEKAIDDTFAKIAKKNRIDIEEVDPMELLSNRYECEAFAYALNNGAHGFKVKKDIQRLNDLSNNLYTIQSFLKEPDFSTKDLFAEILQLRGISTEVIDGKTSYEEKTFSELLVIQIKKAPGEEDLDEDCEDEELLGNLQFLFELAKPNPVDEEDAIDSPETPMGFYNKIERYQLKTKELRIDLREWSKKQNALSEEERSPLPGIYLGTGHSTKGAEWKNVFVQMPKRIFPYESFPRPGEPEKTPAELQSDLESERRLAYVCLTRARESLTVICPSIVNGREAGISQFVVEAGLKIGENIQ